MYFPEFPGRAALLAFVVSLLAACGGGGGGGSSAASAAGLASVGSAAGSIVLTPAPDPALSRNLLAVTIDRGPAGNNVNRLYTDVTICQPGSITQCQTIDHVLVDTGSTGLRLLSSVVAPALNLARSAAASGFPLLACANFVDNSFAWGPVVTADVILAGRTAASMPIQVMGDPATNALAGACSSGTAIEAVATLGAKGIIGMSLFREDCGSPCTTVTPNRFYYACTSASCGAVIATRASISKQLKNPVPLFASDSNGFVIELPAVSPPGAASLNGSVIFGIGTQANNQFTSGAVLTTSAQGYFTTLFEGRTLATSFLDTGSNGLYFDSGAIPTCAGVNAGFYCPASATALSAIQIGANGVSVPVSFSVDNAQALFTAPPKTVLPTLAGTVGDARTFDWGLPFFYGRRVFFGVEGQTSVLGTGPLYAF